MELWASAGRPWANTPTWKFTEIPLPLFIGVVVRHLQLWLIPTTKNGYAAFDFWLENPAAPTPEALIISFTLNGTYPDAGTPTTCSFQIQQAFDDYGYHINTDRLKNVKLGNLYALGTNAQKNIALGSGVAPTSFPADMASMWVADINAAAGKAGFHMMAESSSAAPVALVVSGAILKATTGDPAQVHENLWCINSFDHTVKIYAEGGWKALPVGSSILPAPNGGTGQGVYVVGDLLFASATDALSRLPAVAIGQVMSSAGVGVAPAWAPRDGYTLPVHAASFDPADSQNYYFGCLPHYGPDTNATRHATRIQFTGTITNAFIRWYAGGAAGTNENVSVYIRLNNTTDYLIATVGDTNAAKTFINDALSIAVAANDMIEIKIVTPAWVTNPIGVRTGGVLRIG